MCARTITRPLFFRKSIFLPLGYINPATIFQGTNSRRDNVGQLRDFATTEM